MQSPGGSGKGKDLLGAGFAGCGGRRGGEDWSADIERDKRNNAGQFGFYLLHGWRFVILAKAIFGGADGAFRRGGECRTQNIFAVKNDSGGQ